MNRCRIFATVALIAMAHATHAHIARAQGIGRPPQYVEYRADAISGDGTSLQLGGGVVVPMGIYVRLGLIGAAGPTWRDNATLLGGRVDAVARFTFDPLRETPYALSLGGGISVPYVAGDERLRPLLTAVIDIEGRQQGKYTPAFQVGLGGGVRVGVSIRTSPTRWR